MSVIDRALQYSLEKLGYEKFKPQQDKVVREYLGGNDVFAALPTGYGKSLCYACLPYAFDSIRGKEGSIVILCVSPLTSLMMDQKAKFVPRGLSAEFVGEAQYDLGVIDAVREGKIQLLFISPESLLTNSQWRDMLRCTVYKDNLVAFIVDEAHCVKKWGDEFRVEYARLGEVRGLIPQDVKVMALTATATKSTRKCVIKRLSMHNPKIVSVTPNRPNIIYRVKEKTTMEEALDKIITALKKQQIVRSHKVIIFCRRYEDCGRMYELFKSELGKAFTLPAGAPDLARFRQVDIYTKCTETSVKETIVSNFCDANSPLTVVIATIALFHRQQQFTRHHRSKRT